ncbi:hypothetical protein PG984_015654 [Apiospora sp. TS-2023a]
MRLVLVCTTLIAAGVSASPIEARQFGPVNGSMDLYSEPGCLDTGILGKDVPITDGCTNLDQPAASIKYHGATGKGDITYASKSYRY